jgi:hypothetical protein
MPEQIQLFLILTGAIFAIIVLFSWWFIFNRSPLKIFVMFLSMLINRGSVSANKPIPPDETPRLSDTLEEEGEKLSFDAALQREQVKRPMQVQTAQVQAPASEHATMSDLGYPRPLSETEKDNPRAFLKMNIDKDKE